MVLADGGGGSGPALDYAAMQEAAGSLASAAQGLDSSGTTVPACGSYGDASALVAAILGAYADTGARVTAEALTIADVVNVCSADMQCTDAAQAVQILTNGVG